MTDLAKKLSRQILLALNITAILFAASATPVAAEHLNLSSEERAWLDQNPDKLVLYYDPAFPPLEFRDHNGKYSGLCADVISKVERELNVHFIKKPAPDWSKVMPALQSGVCAITPAIVKTAEREAIINFTSSFASGPIVIITTQDAKDRTELKDLSGKRVGVVTGYATEGYLRNQAAKYKFKVVEVTNIDDGLKQVAFGRIDAFVENIAAAAYYIDKNGISNLKVAGTTDYIFEFRIGVSRRYPLLFSSLQKALAAIPDDELETVRKKWINIEPRTGLSQQDIWLLKASGIFTLLLILGLGGISIILKRRLDLKVIDLRQSEARYRRLAENSPAVVYQFRYKPGSKVAFTYISEAALQVTGIASNEIMRDPDALLSLIDPQELANIRLDIQKIHRSGKPYHAFLCLHRPDKPVWVETLLNLERQLDDSLLCDGFFTDISERLQTQAALLESEARFMKVFRASSDAILLIENNVFVDCNDATLKMLGYSNREEFLNRHPGQLSPPIQPDGQNSFSKSEEMIRQARAKGSQHFEWTHRRANGEDFPVEISLTPIVHAGKDMIYCVWYDLSERKRLESELNQKRKQFESLVRCFPGTVYQCLPDENWSMLYMSKEIDSITGYPTSDFIGNKLRSYESVIHPDDRAMVRDAIEAALKAGLFWSIEYRVLHRDGDIRWVHEEGWGLVSPDAKIERLDGYIFDITDRKQAEQALVESEAKLRSLLCAMQDVILVLDADGRYIEVGPTATDLLYRQPEEVLGKTLADVLPEDLAQVGLECIQDVLAHGTRRLLDYCLEIKNCAVWFTASISPFTNERVLWVARDVTERKQAELESDKLREQLIQAHKMESVGRLAGGVAHDFNNMLGVIIGHTEMALERLKPEEPVYGDLQDVRKAAQRSAELTHQLLTFARKQTIAPKVLDINKTVDGMLSMLRRLIGESIELFWRPGFGLLQIKMDPSQVDQILANLCVNARDAIDGTGEIIIATESMTITEEDCSSIPECKAGDYVLLSVNDNGCGMDEQTIASLFEPFFTTKEVGKGTGLGLATVYGIVRQNSGFITVDSSIDNGSTFRVYLPSHNEEPEAKTHNAPSAPARHGKEIILLVEDEPAILKMTTKMLSSLGYTVMAAANPGEAQSIAEENAGRIDLLITDVIMPQTNGRELTNRLIGSQPDLRVLFMSGYTASIIDQHGVLKEDKFFLQKPFSLQELSAKVRRVLDDKP